MENSGFISTKLFSEILPYKWRKPRFYRGFLGLYLFVASWWQRYKDSNLKWRIQRLAIFFRIAYLSHFSDFLSLKNLSEFCFRLTQQIRMRSCEPYTEVCRETLNPHYYLQQGTVQFDDEEYKSVLRLVLQTKCHIWRQINNIIFYD